MKSLIVACILGIMGCGGYNASSPIAPTESTPINIIPKRNDLLPDWIEVNGNCIATKSSLIPICATHWSYGVPNDFVPLISSDTILSEYHSDKQKLNITFVIHKKPNPNSSLQQFVMDEFISPNIANDKFLVDAKSNIKNNGIAVHLIQKMKNGTYNAWLDFFQQANDAVFHLSCYGEALNLKNKALTCFEIFDTLRLK